MNHQPVAERLIPEADADRAEIRSQLERILQSTLFSGSKRYSALLRYVVEKALDSPAEDLKERGLGIDVFGRQPDYDTSIDPIVRVAAGEVRKRLSLYYHEAGRASAITIQIPSGSYEAQFFASAGVPPAPAETPDTSRAITESAGMAPPTGDVRHQRHFPRRWLYSAIAVSVLLLIGLGLNLAHVVPRQEDRAREFWAPFLDPSSPTLICAADLITAERQLKLGIASQGILDGSTGAYIRTQDLVYVSDVIEVTKLAVKIGAAGDAYRVVTSNSTNLTDLRQGPVILVGGVGNAWTLRVLEQLRFGFRAQPRAFATGMITDKKNPDDARWTVAYAVPLEKLSKDYGIVARLKDSITEKPVMVIAGLAVSGKSAASEVVTNSQYLNQLLASAPQDWQNKNMEAVIETDVIGGRPGPPKVVAIQYW